MSTKNKSIAALISLTIIVIISYIVYGLYLLADEDKYGDLIYIQDKVENGDIILKCSVEYIDNDKSVFDKIGIIEKSFGTVYVWDTENTVKQDLFDWAEKHNAQKIIVLRTKFKTKTDMVPKVDGNYNYLLNSDEYEFVTETF